MAQKGTVNCTSVTPSTLISSAQFAEGSAEPRQLLRKHESCFLICHIALNCAVVISVLVVCPLYKTHEMSSLYRLLAVISIFLVIVIYPGFDVYKQTDRFYKMAVRISLAWMTTIAVLIVLAFLSKTSEEYSREVIIAWFVTVSIVQIPLLRLNYFAVSYYRKKNNKPINCVVIGLGRTARYFSNKLHRNHCLPDNIIGMVIGYNQDISESIHKQLAFSLLGELTNIKSIIQTHAVKRVYISLPLNLLKK